MNERALLRGLCCLSLLLACCRDKTPTHADKEPPAKVTSATAGVAMASPAPPPASASATPSASAAPAPLPLEHGAPLACDLTYIDSDASYPGLRLHALQGAFLVTRGADMFRFDDDKLLEQRYAFAAAHPAQEFVSLGGRYPDAISGKALVGTRMTSDRGDWYSFDKADVWGPIDGLVAEVNDELPGATWLHGSRLVYRNRSFSALLAGKNAALPKLAASTERDCESELRLKAFAAGLDGAVLAAGPRCGVTGQLVAERWEGGKSDGRVLPLPSRTDPTGAVLTVVLGAGRLGAIVASDAGYAATWRESADGFHELLTPVLPDPYSFAVGVEGELWFVSRPTAVEHDRARAFYFDGARFSELQLPTDKDLREKLQKPAAPETFWLRPNNFAIRGEKVYLAASVMQGNDRLVGSAILTPVRAPAAGGIDTADADEPAELGCVPQVVLFSVSKTTPADYQYPATRDAIIGTRFADSAQFLEITRSGQRTLVATTKTRKEARELAAHIKERIAGSRPAVVCEPAPEVVRPDLDALARTSHVTARGPRLTITGARW